MLRVCLVLRRPLERSGRLLQPGDRIEVSVAEAQALIDTAFADPEGAVRVPERPKNWVRSWRN